MAAKYEDVFKMLDVLERYVPRHVSIRMLDEINDAIKDTANRSVRATLRRLRDTLWDRVEAYNWPEQRPTVLIESPTPPDQQANRDAWNRAIREQS